MSSPLFSSGDYLARNALLIGAEDSKKFTISLWFLTGNASVERVIFHSKTASQIIVYLVIRTSGEIKLILRNSSGTTLYNAFTASTYEDSLWHHLVISVDLSVPVVSWRVDGSAPSITVATAATDGTLPFGSCTSWGVANTGLGDDENFTGALYDLLFKSGQYVDITNEDTLELFVSSDGRSASGNYFWQNNGPNSGRKPVGYGIGAPIFNGEKADIYISGAFQDNKGTGGAFVANGLPFGSNAGPDVYRAAAHYDNRERWFDSELTGFSYTRSRTFIEFREGHPKRGLRMGIDEMDEPFRQERPADTYQQLLFQDREDDTEEWDR